MTNHLIEGVERRSIPGQRFRRDVLEVEPVGQELIEMATRRYS
jgi:hypothetical protein